jgi:hypothetical protein
MADVKNPFELLDAGDENADPEQLAAKAPKVCQASSSTSSSSQARGEGWTRVSRW